MDQRTYEPTSPTAMTSPLARVPILAVAALAAAWPGSRGAPRQEEARCRAARQFLAEVVGMTAVVEPDTVNDWRTRKRVPGCRVTAAGLTSRPLADEAVLFYERLRTAGWSRTPDPRDAPGEASLRFRSGGSDCLFNIYAGTTVGTRAEIEVNNALAPRSGYQRYNVLALCVRAME